MRMSLNSWRTFRIVVKLILISVIVNFSICLHVSLTLRINIFHILNWCILFARVHQMAAIFPELDKPSCVATKWTRHMGFCITFSSLLMKTWRLVARLLVWWCCWCWWCWHCVGVVVLVLWLVFSCWSILCWCCDVICYWYWCFSLYNLMGHLNKMGIFPNL